MDTIDRIERTLDTLRPYIASHKGHVEVVDFDEQDGTNHSKRVSPLHWPGFRTRGWRTICCPRA